MRDHLGNYQISSDLTFARGILLLDDCEGTFTWIVLGTGGDDVHAYATPAAFMGLNGLRMKTRVTAAAQNDYLDVHKFVGVPESGLLVYRTRLCFPNLTGQASVNMNVAFYNASREWRAMLSVVPATGAVSYYDSAGGMTAVAGLAGLLPAVGWATMELVLDLNTMEYVEAAWDGNRVSLAGIGMYDLGVSTDRAVYVGISIIASAAPPAEIYADNIYVGEHRDL